MNMQIAFENHWHARREEELARQDFLDALEAGEVTGCPFDGDSESMQWACGRCKYRICQ